MINILQQLAQLQNISPQLIQAAVAARKATDRDSRRQSEEALAQQRAWFEYYRQKLLKEMG